MADVMEMEEVMDQHEVIAAISLIGSDELASLIEAYKFHVTDSGIVMRIDGKLHEVLEAVRQGKSRAYILALIAELGRLVEDAEATWDQCRALEADKGHRARMRP